MKRTWSVRLSMAAAFAMAAIFASTTLAGTNAWTTLGPEGGTPEEIVVHPSDASVAYLLSTGGMFKTTNGGETWQFLRHLSSGTVRDLTIHPTSGQLVLVDSFVSRSTDGGLSFPGFSPSIGQTEVAEYSRDGAVLYAAGFDRFSRSTDQGVTWEKRTNMPAAAATGYAMEIVVDPADGNVVYVRSAHAGLLRTRDGGGTWDSLTTPGSWLSQITISPRNPSRLWARNAEGVHYSDDQGAHWTTAFAQYPSAMAADPSNANLLYIATEQDGLFRSTNGGTTWTQISTGGARLGRIQRITVNRSDSNHILVGSDEGVVISKDGGATWARRSKGFVATTVSTLSSSPNTGRIYLGGYNDGLYRLDTGSDQISALDLGGVRAQILGGNRPLIWSVLAQPLDPDRIFLGTNQGLFRTANAGATWSLVPTSMLPSVSTGPIVAAIGNPNLLLTNSSNVIYRSIDGGLNWTPTIGLPAYSSVRTLAFGTTTAYASLAVFPPGGNWTPSGIYRSVDSGATWQPANTGIESVNVVDIAIHPSNEARLIISADTGFKRSSDRGTTWSDMTFRAQQGATHLIAMDPVTPSTLYASAGGRVERSIDDGQSWERLHTNGREHWIPTQLVVDPQQRSRILLGTNGAGLQSYSIAPDLALNSPVSQMSSAPGTATTHSFIATNVGPHHATHAKMTIQIPDSATNVAPTIVWGPGTCSSANNVITCDFHPLRTGVQMRVDVSVTFPEAGEYSITSSISAEQPDPVASNNSKVVTSSVGVTATPIPPPPTTPTPPTPPTGGGNTGGGGSTGGSSGGGGGGHFDSYLLLALALLVSLQRASARRSVTPAHPALPRAA